MAVPRFPVRFFFALGFSIVLAIDLRAGDVLQGNGPIGRYQFTSQLFTSGTITTNIYRNGATPFPLPCPFPASVPKLASALAMMARDANNTCGTIVSALVGTTGVCVKCSGTPLIDYWGIALQNATVNMRDLGVGTTCGSPLRRPERQRDGGGGQVGGRMQLLFEGKPTVDTTFRILVPGESQNAQQIAVPANTTLEALANIVVNALTARQYVVENQEISPRPEFDGKRTLRIDLVSFMGSPIDLISELSYDNANHVQENDIGYGLIVPLPAVLNFRRGDVNSDGKVNIADPISIVAALFMEAPLPTCLQAADWNGDGGADLSDAVYGLTYEFLHGPPPPAPFPGCGAPTSSLACEASSCR